MTTVLRMMTGASVALLGLGTVTTAAKAQEPLEASARGHGVEADRAAILSVVDAFRRAIIAKDRAALMGLPLSGSITFASAVDPETLSEIRRKRPAAKRWQQSSYAAFVEEVATATARQEEVFSNVRVQNDGAVADVYFDYAFKEDDVVTNVGHESWSMIRTDDGWKIASIVYSVKLPPPRG